MSTSIIHQDSRDKVFALPEICGRISRYLDGKTIVSCSSVSRAWHNYWLPIIWHTIDKQPWAHQSFKESLGKHGDLIRNLTCGRFDKIGLLFKDNDAICRNLITLVLPTTNTTNEADHARLLRQNPLLVDLSLSIREDPSSCYTQLNDAICGLRFLRRLAFEENGTLELSTLETILSQCKNSLRELSLKKTFFMKHPFRSGEEFASGLLAKSDSVNPSTDVEIVAKETFGIQSLCMDNVGCTQDLLFNLGSRFPELTRLSLRGSGEVYFKDDFAVRMTKRCPKIRHLDISDTEALDDEAIATMIKGFPSLQTLRASETRFGDESLAALAECCSDLTMLDIGWTYGTSGQALQHLLERCSSLRVLDAWNVHVNVVDMIADASKIEEAERSLSSSPSASTDRLVVQDSHFPHGVRGQWACHGLESLVINFDYDASELTKDAQRLYPPSRARRFIYEQLSRLTNLRSLTIGASFHVPDSDAGDNDTTSNNTPGISAFSREGVESSEGAETVADKGDSQEQGQESAVSVMDEIDNSFWIDYSLKSGLGLLSPLKHLHTLSLNYIDHDMGIPEMEWISKNWPRLKRIEGLDEDEDVEIIQWLMENRLDIDRHNDDDDYDQE
ncbi:hypothetical protein B0O80DRAFT_466220 [Mortierella sp. GBAus27b]|nr:hypothetical protein BGX31_004092 [Mortierella sp. GBA43]KAI8347156.1 hypothetical protein B0O80DRAFT_466220 [Mortierella sp. GBAus27b]